jgi:hypothetical protein
MSKRKDIIRINDYVKIVTPNIFVRCGYPLTKQIVIDTMVSAEQKQAVFKLLDQFGVGNTNNIFITERETDPRYLKIMDVLASSLLASHGWGGKERKVYTEYKTEFLNKEYRVIGKRVVKSGTYNSGYSHRGYYDNYDDYSPPYLTNEKSHVLLELNTGVLISTGLYGLEIERCNVELVKQEEYSYGNKEIWQ